MTGRLAAAVLALCCLAGRIAAAQPVPPGMTPTEAAVWSAVAAGKTADFNAMYGKIDVEHAGPPDPCRTIGHTFLQTIIELNPEFTEFFNDPGRERLRGWQLVFFAVLGIVGALLGSVLVAAISGLTQAP